MKMLSVGMHGLFGRAARGNPLLSTKNMAACIKFAKFHPYKPQDFYNNVLGQVRPKWRYLA